MVFAGMLRLPPAVHFLQTLQATDHCQDVSYVSGVFETVAGRENGKCETCEHWGPRGMKMVWKKGESDGRKL